MATSVCYRMLFSLLLKHQDATIALDDAFSLRPTAACENTMSRLRMKYKQENNLLNVFYSGSSVDVVTGTNLDPVPGVPDNTTFFFIVELKQGSIINKIKMLNETTATATDEAKALPQCFIMPGVVSIKYNATASVAAYEQFVIKDISSRVVDVIDVRKDDSGNYSCAADMSLQQPGIYSFTLGTVTKKYYVDTTGEMAGSYGYIRLVTKSLGPDAWIKPLTLTPVPAAPDYNQFSYSFPNI